VTCGVGADNNGVINADAGLTAPSTKLIIQLVTATRT
jgi:hypothetical protein